MKTVPHTAAAIMSQFKSVLLLFLSLMITSVLEKQRRGSEEISSTKMMEHRMYEDKVKTKEITIRRGSRLTLDSFFRAL